MIYLTNKNQCESIENQKNLEIELLKKALATFLLNEVAEEEDLRLINLKDTTSG